MKISLVGPKWNEMVNSYPSLGLGYLAAVAERAGHQVAVHDFGLRPHTTLGEDAQKIIDDKPDVVAFTSMTTSYHHIEQLVEIVKDTLGVPTVIGGPHATSLPQLTIENPHIDYLIYGEGEEVWLELLQAIETGDTRYGRIAGLWWKDDGKVVENPQRKLIEDLDALPFPARHLFEMDKYPLYAPNGEKMLTVLSSRGCPYNCSFCFKGVVGRTYRQRSPENIVEELRQLQQQYQVRNFYFIDDLFTIDVRRLEKIMDYFIEQKMDVRWRCLARVDRVNPELLHKMYAAGCRQVHFGIESGNEEVLKATAKHINLEQIRRAIEWTAESGIDSKGYFILGLPGDTEETMEQTIEFASSLPLTEAMFSIATPFPGTRLWDELVRRNPQTQYNADFTKTYYYNSYTAEIAPFMNVSDVPDERLSGLAIEARRRFDESKRRRMYERSFGKTLGPALWEVSRLKPLRQLGNALVGAGMLGSFRQVRERAGANSWA